MNRENTRCGVEALRRLVCQMREAQVHSRDGWRQWAKEKETLLGQILAYPGAAGMPRVSSLVTADFHSSLPLVMFNYSPVAHNCLHEHPAGWTLPLRLCRGIVFDRQTGELVALPWDKFFNYGEHPETQTWPAGRFEATEKEDGHLGIIFWYRDQICFTTRGSFTSPTVGIGTEMLAKQSRFSGWRQHFPRELTLLVETIHPQTRVLTEYGGQHEFCLIGARDINTFADLAHAELVALGGRLNWRVAQQWDGTNLDDLKRMMSDRSIRNREGYVVFFPESGLRIKLKYETYIGLMVAGKLSYTYLMNRWLAGNLERMVATLDEEIHGVALQMIGRLFLLVNAPGSLRERWNRLYTLVPPEESTSYFQGVCRKFVKHIFESPLATVAAE